MEYTPSPQLEKLKSEKEKNEKKIEHDYSCRLPENIIILFYWTAPKRLFLKKAISLPSHSKAPSRPSSVPLIRIILSFYNLICTY